MTRQSLRDQRNAARRGFEKRPFTMAIRMYDIEKWGKTPEGEKIIKTALVAIQLCDYKEAFTRVRGYIII